MSRLLDLFFPPRCPFCRRLLPWGVPGPCASCASVLPYAGMADRRRRGDFLEGIVSPLYYRDSVRSAILGFKFHSRPGYARVFAAMMASAVREVLPPGSFDAVSWVPIHPIRRFRRGYDQSRLMAKVLARELGVPCVKMLRKVRNNPPQAGIAAPEARRANVSGAYRALTKAAGRKILLTDDVITTGATLSECARTLLMAGAEHVYGVTLAQKPDKKMSGRKKESLIGKVR